MDLLQIILESRQEYFDMVFRIPIHLSDGRTITSYDADLDQDASEDSETRSPLRYYVEKVRETMVRRDRIVWAMRYLKLLVAKEIRLVVDEENANADEENPGFFYSKFGVLPSPEQPEVDEIISRLSWLDLSWVTKPGDCYQIIDDLLRRVAHYIQVGEALAHNVDHPSPNNRLRAYVFDKQPVQRVVDDLQRIEKESREETRNGVSATTGTPVIEFPNKWAWFDLGSFCDNSEAASMGHCGNSGGNTGQTILSLRQPLKRGWMPHATFILDKSSKALGEMKGYANQKPNPKYHGYIVDLLKNKSLVRKVVGAGWLPENNFCLYVSDGMPQALNGWTDLSDRMAYDLHQHRPDIWIQNDVCQYCLNTGVNRGDAASEACLLALSISKQR